MAEGTKYGLLESDINQIVMVMQQNLKITKVVLFGSRAKGTWHAWSDVDLALFGDDLVLNDILELTIEIETLNLPYKSDLAIFKRIKETALIEHINRVGVKLFERKTIRRLS